MSEVMDRSPCDVAMRDCPLSLSEMPFVRENLIHQGSLYPLDQVEELTGMDDGDRDDALRYSYVMALDLKSELEGLLRILDTAQGGVDIRGLVAARVLEQDWLMDEIDVALRRGEPDPDRASRHAAALAPLLPGLAGVEDGYFGALIREARARSTASRPEVTATATGAQPDAATAEAAAT